ncbi:phage tail protein [Pseudomonas alkylphenolica]|uniref:phage tail protein n=1 Tax=Pseudomonas alkylphenolica TaxID=237609 RepID=UPI001F4F9AEB|nr:phage tail protein [Pseudomonas alkylphenolica]
MTDQTSQFFAILTAVGEAKQANANALGIPWTFAQMGVGDANQTEPIPSRTQTKLINERRRAPLNQVKIDPDNANIIIAEQVIPPDVGGWWIREIGLYDAAGDLVAVANCAPSFKPLLTQGTGKTQVVRLNIIVTSTANVELKIDPAVVLATRQYVQETLTEELNKLDRKNSVRVATTANIVRSGLQTIDGVALVAGDRVLVKNQTSPQDNGLYTAAAAGWSRTLDADANVEVTSGMTVPVEQGALNADTCWQLITDGVVVVGVTQLNFVEAGAARQPLAANLTAFSGLAGAADRLPYFSGAGALSLAPFTDFGRKQAAAADDAAARTLLGLAASVLLTTHVNSAPMGVTLHFTGTEAECVAQGFPALGGLSTTLRFWILSTEGVSNRTTQRAKEVFGGLTPRNRVFERVKHDLVWYGWDETLTSAFVASQAEVNAGTDDTKVVTPKKLRFGFASLFTANGYVALPSWLGGLVFQWGTLSVADSTGVYSFARTITYPNSHLVDMFTDISSGGGGARAFAAAAGGARDTISVTSDGAPGGPGGLFYLSIGY